MTHRRTLTVVLGVLAMLAPARPAPACSFCSAAFRLSFTFREEAARPSARVILVGTIRTPRDSTNSEFRIASVLRSDPAVKGKTVLPLGRYQPDSDAKYVAFCDVFEGKIDPWRAVAVKGDGGIEYVKKVLALGNKDPVAKLTFYFRHLDDPDPEVSNDAFKEFARSTDQDIARAAGKLAPDKLRAWLKDPKTPRERIAVYAMLLGSCGKDEDATLLRGLLDRKEDRYANAFGGILAGYIHRKPRGGWDLALNVLRDPRKPLLMRIAVLGTVRYFHGAQPRESRANVLKVEAVTLAQADLADIAVEDLRQWAVWDLTPEVLALYGKKGYDAPLMQRAILRYALSCKPTAESKAFLAKRRAVEPDLVKDIEESLNAEKAK
jgi:hypothetical protein